MSRKDWLIAACAAVSSAIGSFATAADLSSHEIAIVHGKLLTISHGVIENGTVIIGGGRLIAVGGPEISVPPE